MPSTPPVIPGWDVRVGDNRVSAHYLAARQAALTRYQREFGALPEVYARTEGELWLLCDAQTRLAERLATAEATRPAVHPLNR